MAEYKLIYKLFGDEPFISELYEGQIVRILGRHSTGGVMVTAMGVNNPDSHYDDGNWDTLLCEECLCDPTMCLNDGDGFSGIIMPDGRWVQIGGGMHVDLIRFMARAFNEQPCDSSIVFSSTRSGGDYVHGGRVTDAVKKAFNKHVEEHCSSEQVELFEELKEDC